MSHYVRHSFPPHTSVTDHGLVKLIVMRALEEENRTWTQFFTDAIKKPLGVEDDSNSESKEEKESYSIILSNREREESQETKMELGQGIGE